MCLKWKGIQKSESTKSRREGNKAMIDELTNIIITFLSATFLISSIPKIVNLNHFINLVVEYKILPKTLSVLYAIMLPFTELIFAILILNERTVIYGTVGLLFILITFKIAVFINVKNKKEILCGCHGKLLDTKVGKFTLLKIGALILCVLVLLISGMAQTVHIQYSFLTAFSGIYLSILFLLVQKAWSTHKDSIDKLQNIKN